MKVGGARLVAILLLGLGLRAGGQITGSCPPSRASGPWNVQALHGVVVDQNLAVVPKLKVRLQVQDGQDFRDIGSGETDATGRFDFAPRHAGEYRLVFAGGHGLCPAAVLVKQSKSGFRGIRLTLPIAASDTCPSYCESRLKIEEMTGREGRE